MRVETLTGSMDGPLRARTNGLPLGKGQRFWALYWQIAIILTASVLCGVQLSTSRAKMPVSLHILHQTGKVPRPSVLDQQKKKGSIKCLYEHGVRGTKTCAQWSSTCKFLVLIRVAATKHWRRDEAWSSSKVQQQGHETRKGRRAVARLLLPVPRDSEKVKKNGKERISAREHVRTASQGLPDAS